MSISCHVRAVNVQDAMQKADLMETAAVTAITQAAERDSRPYVPWLTGDLAGTAERQSIYEQGKLIYGDADVVYAAAQYYANDASWNRNTPGTTSRWFDHAEAQHLNQWIEEGKAAIRNL